MLLFLMVLYSLCCNFALSRVCEEWDGIRDISKPTVSEMDSPKSKT